jgi:hypothetical protein
MKNWTFVFLALMALSLPPCLRAQDSLKTEVGGRFVISPDYTDVLDAAYPDADISGGYGWLGVDVGLRCRASQSVIITPRVGLLFNYVIMVNGGDDDFFNSIIQPALSARYLFSGGSGPFIEGEVTYSSVETGSDAFDVDGGAGYGGFVGWNWDDRADLSLGYSDIPTDVTYTHRSRAEETEEVNFGGFEVRVRAAF